ncbi:MAG: methyl-accepting chemotaxis protein [Treponema sp.]|nr:methyl-accepting chemotaxis protein [Treponema sp.]
MRALNTLKGKIIIPIVGVLFVLMVFIFIYVSMTTTELANHLTRERVTSVSMAAQAHMTLLEEYNLMTARAVAGSHTLQGFVRDWNNNIARPQTRQALLQYLLGRKDYFGITAFVVADHEGIMILRSHDLATYGDSGLVSPLIALALQQGRSSIAYSSTPAMPMGLTGAVPIQDADGIIGMISAIVEIDTEEFVDNFGATFYAAITVYAGTERVATTIIDPVTGRRPIGTQAGGDVVQLVLEQGQIFDNPVTLFGTPYHGYYFPLAGWGGTPVGMFFIGFSLQYTINETAEMQRYLVLIGFVALAVTITLMLLYLIRVFKPLDLLRNNLNDIANGDADLTKRLPITGKDEIAESSGYFNQLMDQFKNMITSIKQQSGELSSIGNDLASNMTETASAMNQIAANIQSIKNRIMNQSASVSQTNSTMEQVISNINRLNSHVENQTSNITQASSAIEEMVANTRSVTDTIVKNDKNVKTLMEASEVGRSGLQGVAEDIQEIARESEGLLEINSVMENIASQTNLLSMNAAIEAAHAGDAGRGFAVVADEIRKLAESSSEQSKIIGTVLKKIKESIDKITSSTENVLNRFESIDSSVKTVAEQETNIRYAMEEQGSGNKQILQGVSNVNEITRQVNAASHEMLSGAQEVIQESSNLEKLTQEITTGMNEMASGAEQVNVAVNHVNEISVKTREGIGSLLREVSRFKVD